MTDADGRQVQPFLPHRATQARPLGPLRAPRYPGPRIDMTSENLSDKVPRLLPDSAQTAHPKNTHHVQPRTPQPGRTGTARRTVPKGFAAPLPGQAGHPPSPRQAKEAPDPLMVADKKLPPLAQRLPGPCWSSRPRRSAPTAARCARPLAAAPTTTASCACGRQPGPGALEHGLHRGAAPWPSAEVNANSTEFTFTCAPA